MDGYSAAEIFEPEQISIFKRATAMVARLPPDPEYKIRCHELARAIGELLGLTVVDGKFRAVDHSWCLISSKSRMPVILDAYAMGRLPMVQLVSRSIAYLPDPGYIEGATRTDIRPEMVARLRNLLGTARSCYPDLKWPATEDRKRRAPSGEKRHPRKTGSHAG